DGQIAHKIIGTNRHQPTADSFNNDVLNSILKSVKRSQDPLEIDAGLLHETANKRRGRRLEPDRVDLLDPQPFTAGSEQKLCVAAISATDRLHSGAASP